MAWGRATKEPELLLPELALIWSCAPILWLKPLGCPKGLAGSRCGSLIKFEELECIGLENIERSKKEYLKI